MIVLASHADDAGLCWPAADRISLHSGASVRSVRTAIQDLEQTKLLSIERSQGRTSNRYILHFNNAPDAGLIDLVERPKGRKIPRSNAINRASGALLDDTPTVHGAPSNPAPDVFQPCTGRRNHAAGAVNRARGSPEPSEPSINHQLTLTEPSGISAQDIIESAIGVWNLVCGKMGGIVIKITAPRKSGLKARLRECFSNDLDRWRGYCETISSSAFLTGENDRGWRADFDWAVKPANMIKVLEGKYTNRKPKSSGNAVVDWMEESGIDITQSLDDLISPEGTVNGYQTTSPDGRDLGREIVAPNDWWEDTTDKANNQLVCRNPRR